MRGLIHGRHCHYVGEDGDHYAGIITRVADFRARLVNIFVLPRKAGEAGGVVEMASFQSPLSARALRPGTWHWVERVDDPEESGVSPV